ncbi:MAG: hypothetical protein ABIJ21_03395, partial [Nanoarchaeota archaeon]
KHLKTSQTNFRLLNHISYFVANYYLCISLLRNIDQVKKLRNQLNKYTFFKKKYRSASVLSFLFSLAILLFLLVIIIVPAKNASISVYFAFSVLPFLFGGMCLSSLFDLFGQYSGKLYFYDLLGASIGALCVPILLVFIHPESLIILTAIMPLLASLLFLKSSRFRLYFFFAMVLLLMGFFLFNVATNTITLPIGENKALAQHLEADRNLHIVKTDWNSFSRVDLVEGFGDDFLANNYIDTFAWTFILPWDAYSMNYTRDWFRYFPFHVKPKSKVLIIGTGGGTDVALALASESRDVTAVEINPSIVENVREYGERAGNIYNSPYVDVFVEEGRNFVSRSNQTYDMVLLGFVDSSSAIVSGGLVMSENYLYTVEAFEDYLAHVNDDGVLALVRYEVDIPRLVTIAKEALNNLGVQGDVKNHLIAVSQTDPSQIEEFLGNQMVFIIKKTPFTEDEINQIRPIIEEKKWAPVILPYNNIDAPYAQFLSGQMSYSEFESKFDINVQATHDNNPFYFAYYKPIGIPLHFVKILSIPFIISLILFGIVLVFKRFIRKDKINLKVSYLLYFSGLGAGFMLMEIPILQKFILLLGKPIYTFSVILFSLLFSTSLGSLASSYVSVKKLPRVIVYASIAVILMTTVYLFSLSTIIQFLLPFSLVARIFMTFVLLFPLGFVIGIPFPSGIRLLKKDNQDVPLAWGINGLSSVFGSVLATVIGVAVGFSTALILSMVSYGVVIVSIMFASKKWNSS